MILESYAKFILINSQTGNKPCQPVQCSTVPNNKKTTIIYKLLMMLPLSRVNVTGLLRRLQVNIQVFKIIK